MSSTSQFTPTETSAVAFTCNYNNVPTGNDFLTQFDSMFGADMTTTHPEYPDEFTETIERFPDFINGTNGDLDIAGHAKTLSSLRSVCLGGGKVQKISPNGPHMAFLPLECALQHLCFHIGQICPSARELYDMHHGADYPDTLSAVGFGAGGTLPMAEDSLDLKKFSALLHLLALRELQSTKQYRPYQLGLLCIEDDFLHARIYPQAVSNAIGTVWFYHQPADSLNHSSGTWYGICSDEALGLQVLSSTPSSTASPKTISSEEDPSSLTIASKSSVSPRSVSKDKGPCSAVRKTGSSSPEYRINKHDRKGRRKTATQIQELHNEFPDNFTPTAILNHPGDVLHYNNLLRVAVWFGNKEIFDRLNAIREQNNKAPHKALSAITKRIGVACSYLAKEHDIPLEVFRKAFNAKRAQNNIATREVPDPRKASSEWMAQMNQYRDRIDAAFERVLSPTPLAGLASYEKHGDLRSDHNPTKPQNPSSLVTPGGVANLEETPTNTEVMRASRDTPILAKALSENNNTWTHGPESTALRSSLLVSPVKIHPFEFGLPDPANWSDFDSYQPLFPYQADPELYEGAMEDWQVTNKGFFGQIS